jgi:hypothetical protein
MKIAITGGSSVISKYLFSTLKNSENDLKLFSRNQVENYYDIENFSKNKFAGYDVVIHMANMNSSNHAFNNIYKEYEMFLSNSKQRNIFISSMSAHEKNSSNYSLHKLRLEKLFLMYGSYVIRPGLIFNDIETFDQPRAFSDIKLFLRMVKCNFLFENRYFITPISTLARDINTTLKISSRQSRLTVLDSYSYGPLDISQLRKFCDSDLRTLTNENCFRSGMYTKKILIILKNRVRFADKLLNFQEGMEITFRESIYSNSPRHI